VSNTQAYQISKDGSVIRRALGTLGATLLLVGIPGVAFAQSPEGPRLAFVRLDPSRPAEELLITDPLGERFDGLARGSDSKPIEIEDISWSGDGTRIAFGGSYWTSHWIYTVPVVGGRPQAVPGADGFNPVFSPDGRTIAFARVEFREQAMGHKGFSVSIWLADVQGGGVRRLTSLRDGRSLVPSSFSPDGAELAAVRREPGSSPEVVSLRLSGGHPSVIVQNGTEPVYSPDGATIVFARWKNRGWVDRGGPWHVWGGDLFRVAANGSGVGRLTYTPANREARPSWDPSGERLVFTQFPSKLTFDALAGIGSTIVEVNADGTCRRRLLFTPGLSYQAAAWQPGPGREAGRIAC
jgi:Tol biopolymer transport system component